VAVAWALRTLIPGIFFLVLPRLLCGLVLPAVGAHDDAERCARAAASQAALRSLAGSALPARPPARVRRVAGLGGAHRSALRAEREALVASATALGLKDIVLRRLVREVDLQEAQPGP
jgi:hypothetical protein